MPIIPSQPILVALAVIVFEIWCFKIQLEQNCYTLFPRGKYGVQTSIIIYVQYCQITLNYINR